MVSLTVSIPSGTAVTVRDASGRAVAGSTARDGAATAMVPAPRSASDYAVESGAGPATELIGRVTLDGSTPGGLERPIVDRSVNTGSRAVAHVTGEPGAVVTVTDADDRVVGVRSLGLSGSADVPVIAPVALDESYRVSQRMGGDVSPRSDFDIAAPAMVEVGHVASDAAVVAFTAVTGTNWPLSVVDEHGKEVAGGRFASSGPTTRILPLTPGVVNHFTVARGSEGGPWTSTVSFDVDARATAPMTDPTVGFVSGSVTRVTGIPGARIEIPTSGLPIDATIGATGIWLDTARRLAPGTTTTVIQTIGSDRSTAVPFTVPRR
jgi:hypothetical protein